MPPGLTGRAVLTLLAAFAAAVGAAFWATSAGGSEKPRPVRPVGSLAVPLDLTAPKGPPLVLGAADSLPALARAPQRHKPASPPASRPEASPAPAAPAPVQNSAPAPSPPPPAPAPAPAPQPAPAPAPAPVPKPAPEPPPVDFDDSG